MENLCKEWDTCNFTRKQKIKARILSGFTRLKNFKFSAMLYLSEQISNYNNFLNLCRLHTSQKEKKEAELTGSEPDKKQKQADKF